LDRPRYIVVEGPIGVGKTSLVEMLVKDFGARPMYEAVEQNPFLERFYEEPAKFAFQTQLFFLL
jgi:deoxyadenosine/deoxycytidine kinase